MADQPTPEAEPFVRARGPKPTPEPVLYARWAKKFNVYNGGRCDPRVKQPDFDYRPPSDDEEGPPMVCMANTNDTRSSASSGNLTPWYADSGCYPHLCKDKDYFHTLEPVSPTRVTAAYGRSTLAKTGGTVVFEAWDADHRRTQRITIQGVLFVPELKQNLLSISMITENNNSCSFEKDRLVVYDKLKRPVLFGHMAAGNMLPS